MKVALPSKLLLGSKVAFEPQAIPAVVFTDPEIAWCGLTETQARQEGRTIEVARFPWGASGRATTLDRNDGVTKLILDPSTSRDTGCWALLVVALVNSLPRACWPLKWRRWLLTWRFRSIHTRPSQKP